MTFCASGALAYKYNVPSLGKEAKEICEIDESNMRVKFLPEILISVQKKPIKNVR